MCGDEPIFKVSFALPPPDMYGSGYGRAKEISIDKTLFHRCRTLRNRQCRHNGKGRYPVLSSASWIPGQARNDWRRYFSKISPGLRRRNERNPLPVKARTNRQVTLYRLKSNVIFPSLRPTVTTPPFFSLPKSSSSESASLISV